ncbi:MAG TPA: SgcJ/EcaC family oxidoreductase [Gemmatimonadales bacterium]|nr:SgcJ/EcaC family oxidoreductase [Gemmatimonadales bacterium]
MRRTASLTAGVALLLLAACQPSNKPQLLTGADSTAIAKVRADYAAAWNRGNVDGVVSLYTDDALLQQADTGALKGSNAIRTYLNSALGTPTRPVLAVTSTALTGRQDLAVDVGTFTLTPPAPPAPAKGAAPAAPAPMSGKYLAVMMKQSDGRWKLTCLASSGDAPMAPPAPAKKGR